MGKIWINETELEYQPGENIIQAAQRAGAEIPHYCWHPDLSVVASCRMCLVETGERKPDGSIAMQPRLSPACQTPTKPDLVIQTGTEKVRKWQGMALELLLLNHPLDCSICDQAGECYLQDYTYKYGKAHSRLDEPKVQRMDKYHIGDQIALFTDRCVMCTRCVRFTREYSGTAELQVVARGSTEEIDVFPGQPCNNKLAGNVVDLCPVGALCSKDFLYKKRVWWLKHQESVCQRCSTGCSIVVDQSDNQVYRIRPRENPNAQGRFMCDEGRFGFKFIHAENRLLAPVIRQRVDGQVVSALATAGSAASSGNGSTKAAGSDNGSALAEVIYVDPWPEIYQSVRKRIAEFASTKGSRFAAVFSPFMTCEEAYLLARYLKGQNRSIKLVLGPVPVVGEDDRYPKGKHGEQPASDKTRFTIRAEKCPNRLGVSAVLKHFQGELLQLEDLLPASSHSIDGMYIVGGYPDPWVTSELDQQIGRLELLVVQDFVSSSLSDRADYVLAGGSFAERNGTVVNYSGLAQEIQAAIRSPGDARQDGRLLMELSERRGLFNAAVVRREMAGAIPAFAPLGNGEMDEYGLQLFKVDQNATAVTSGTR